MWVDVTLQSVKSGEGECGWEMRDGGKDEEDQGCEFLLAVGWNILDNEEGRNSEEAKSVGEEHGVPEGQEGLGRREAVEALPFDGGLTFPSLKARREGTRGVPAGEPEVLGLRGGGSSRPDGSAVCDEPGHACREGFVGQENV